MNLESSLKALLFWERDKDARRTARVAASALASAARGFTGWRVRKVGARPEKRLVLYEMENCPFSRKVREALSILDLEVDVRPCPQGETTHRQELKRIGGKEKLPMLVDPNTMAVLHDSDKIVSYLFAKYGKGKPGLLLRARRLGTATSQLASLLRSNAGTQYEPARRPELPLELWSHEACAESRLVREVLGAFAIPYTLHNCARGSRNLSALKQRAGRAQIPYLYDPGRDVEVAGPGNIIAYLRDTYEMTHHVGGKSMLEQPAHALA